MMKIGITGHQNLGTIQNYNNISSKLKQIISEYPVTCGYTCLAKGADQLFAEVFIQAKIPVYVVIPSDHYEDTFTDKDSLEKYQRFLHNAVQKKTLSFTQPGERAFYEAGKHVADSSDLIIAIWDGKKSKGLGGTADIIDYCLRFNKEVIHLNSNSLEINHL